MIICQQEEVWDCRSQLLLQELLRNYQTAKQQLPFLQHLVFLSCVCGSLHDNGSSPDGFLTASLTTWKIFLIKLINQVLKHQMCVEKRYIPAAQKEISWIYSREGRKQEECQSVNVLYSQKSVGLWNALAWGGGKDIKQEGAPMRTSWPQRSLFGDPPVT